MLNAVKDDLERAFNMATLARMSSETKQKSQDHFKLTKSQRTKVMICVYHARTLPSEPVIRQASKKYMVLAKTKRYHSLNAVYDTENNCSLDHVTIQWN